MSANPIDQIEYDISWIEGEDILLMVEQYKALFARVREYADKDLRAWLVAQDLARVVGQVANIEIENKEGREVRLCQLVKLRPWE